MSSQGTLIDGALATEAVDKSGESLSISGADISSLEEGDGVANFEHLGADSRGMGQEIVGKIIFAKKIFKRSDCDNDRQRKFWDKVKLPLIYGIIRLSDAAGHLGAQALSANIRDNVANGEEPNVRFSVEGSTLSRDGNKLTACIIRKVALTFSPCNRTAFSGLLSDPQAPEGFDKNPEHASKDILETLTEKFEHPNYTKLGGSDISGLLEDTPELLKTIIKAKTIVALAKATEAGNYAGPMSTGGACLQREDLGTKIVHKLWKTQVFKAWHDYDRQKYVFNKSEFKSFLKSELPEIDESFIDKFVNLIDDYKVKLGSVRKSDIDPVIRSEILSVDLRKAVSESVLPNLGFAVGGGQHYQIVSDHPDSFVCMGTEGLVRLPKSKKGTHFDVHMPETKDPSSTVDSLVYGIPGLYNSPEQKELIHGIDISGHDTSPDQASNWVNDKRTGKSLYLRSDSKGNGWNNAKKDVAYYNAARDVFGLDAYLPVSAAFHHPNGDLDVAAIQPIPMAESMDTDDGKIKGTHAAILKNLGDTGELDKLMIMDNVLGVTRNDHNIQFSLHSEPNLKLIDNHKQEGIEDPNTPKTVPSYMVHYGDIVNQPWYSIALNPSILKWIEDIDFRSLESSLARSGMPFSVANEAVRRLIEIKAHILRFGVVATKGSTYVSPFDNKGTGNPS